MTHSLQDATAMNHANTQAFVAEALAIPADRWRTPTATGKWSPAQVSGAAVSRGQKQFEHPFFGSFGVVEYMRFVAFHTAPHQKQLSPPG